jgi:hypothetical protein
VRNGSLAATVVVPANTGLALEMLARNIHSGTIPAERTYTDVRSYPSIEKLALQGRKRKA